MSSHLRSSFADSFRVFIALTGILTAAQIEAAPIIQNNPTSQTLIRGASTQFNVVATGSGTLSYQWQKDGIDIPGATSSNFSLSSAQPWHIGDYTVKVTDSVAALTSAVATLSLNGVDSGIWKGLVAYYPLDSNCNDVSSLQKHGIPTRITYQTDRFSLASKAANFENVPADQGSSIQVPGLINQPFKPVTYSMWVRFGEINDFHTLIGRMKAWNGEVGALVIFNMGLTYHTGGDAIITNYTPATNVWTKVDFTYSENNLAIFYVNGVVIYRGNYNAPQTVGIPFILGAGTVFEGVDGNRTGSLKGQLDDVRIYNRALSTTEVQALYASEATVQFTAQPPSQTVNRGQTVTFSVTASGVGTLSYKWQKDSADIAGATTSNLVVSNVQSSNVGFYRCVVTDSNGSVTSSEASLRITGLPLFRVMQNTFTWQQARVDAEKNGGRLAVLDSQEKINHLNGYLQGMSNQRILWIGLTDEEVEGSWKWINGVSLTAHNWGAGEPNNNGSGEDYAVVLDNGNASKWNDLPPDWWVYTPGGYILEILPQTIFTAHPISQTTRVGGFITLNVEASGTGTLSYQWRKNGLDLTGQVNSSLSLTSLTLADAGSYDVVVSSGSTSTTSNAAVLTVLHAPTLSSISSKQLNEDATLGPLSFTIGDLDTPTEQLTVTASSSSTGLIPNSAIQLAGTGASRTLTLSPVANASGTATITLVVSDGALETSQSFSLTVQAVPDAPTDVTLNPSALAENNATNAVVGTLAAADVDLGDTHTYSFVSGSGSVDNGSFTISGSSLRLSLSADYETKSSYAVRLRATDSTGLYYEKALTVTILNVNEAPTVVGPLTQAMIEDGQEALTFTVADVDTQVSALTLVASSSTNQALLPVSRVTVSGTGSSRSLILDPIEGQNGTATILLTASDGSLNATTTLAVTVYEKDIVIALQTQPQEVSEQSEARFNVVLSSGGEFATYQWQRNNQAIPGATQPELILPSATLSQAGNYHVVITNPQTSAMSNPAVLLVRVLPEIKQQPESLIVNVGDSAGFVVSALGRPTLTYQWRRNGADVASARSRSLDIAAVTTSQAGRYQVRIKNPVNTTGILSNEVELGVVEPSIISRTVTMQQGKVMKLTVTAVGNGLTYLWHKNGAAVSYNGRNKGWDSRELTIDSVTDADEGDYQCQITAPGGTAWGALTSLKVFNLKPKIQRPLLLDDAMVGKSYEFTVPLDLDNGGEATSYVATGLPPGLKINTTTGVISGKPTVAKVEGYFVKIATINSLGRDEETAGIAVAPLRTGTVGTYAAIISLQAWQDFPVPYLPEMYGRLDLTVLSSATYSGSVTLGGVKFPFTGVLDADADVDPTGRFTVKRKGKPDIQGDFTLIPDSGKPRQLIGKITGIHETRDLEMLGWRQPWSSTVKATAYDGMYNLVDDSPDDEELFDPVHGHPVPRSAGYLNFTVGLNGIFNLVGRTGDGERVTCSGFLSEPYYFSQTQAPLYAYISATKGCLAGRLLCGAESSNGARDNGAGTMLLSWHRAPGVKTSRLYKEGFNSVSVSMSGGQYVPPAKGELLLDSVSQPLVLNNAKLDFDGGGAANQPAITFSILADGKLAMPTSTTRTTLSIIAATGMFKGSFVLTDLNPFTKNGIPQSLTRTVSFEGLIVPDRWINAGLGKRGYGSGFFIMPQMPTSVTETLSNSPILGGRVTITTKQ